MKFDIVELFRHTCKRKNQVQPIAAASPSSSSFHLASHPSSSASSPLFSTSCSPLSSTSTSPLSSPSPRSSTSSISSLFSPSKKRVCDGLVLSHSDGFGQNVDDEFLIDSSASSCLGAGSFGKVVRASHRLSHADVAIKIIDKNQSCVEICRIREEIEILMNVKHVNLVHLMDVYEDSRNIYFVMELCDGGSLHDKIIRENPKGLSEKRACNIFKQIVAGTKYLHDHSIIHRDLKPENILFAESFSDFPLKICDFGQSAIVRGASVNRTICGSPHFIAPEVIESSAVGYGFEVDLWSLGVVLYFIVSGQRPFSHKCNSFALLFSNIVTANYGFNSSRWDHVSDACKDLISKLLVVDPKLRLNLNQVLHHEWLC